jgi:argininosuccinate lyase
MPGKRTPQKPRKSWQSRLTAEADGATSQFLASLDIDRALWRYDVTGSIAHARMLAKVGLISSSEFSKIRRGLLSIASDIESGRLKMPVELEDIHMVIEKALIDRIGAVGGKLHAGRSRNDQVATDLRLWARDAIDRLLEGIAELQRAFVRLAQRQGEIVMPAYTHLQRAQPIVAGHALLAYAEMLQRDSDRLSETRRRVNVCPLGSGAIAGTSLPLDRASTARELGFTQISRNSIDATSDRDFLAELCFDCAMLGVHLSRWAEDWIVYSTTEFGVLRLHDAYCTSSSMMPQKKNPDTLELIRAKSAGTIAQLTGMLSLLKGLPTGYSRDLQDDKRFAFAAAAATEEVLAVAAGIVATARFDESRIAATLTEGFLDATALAEYLVRKNVPFRQAHGIVGRLVAAAEKQGVALGQLPLATLQAACPRISRDVFGHLGAANAVRDYAPPGAGGPTQLRRQLAFWKKSLGIK